MNEIILRKTQDGSGSQVQNGFTLLELARGWLQQGNAIVATELLNSAINSVEAEKDQELRARILKETARSKMMQSEWEEADSMYLEAQRLFKDIGNDTGTAECARNRANLYFQRGMYWQAEQYCEQALESASKTDGHELRATILNTIASIKSAKGDLKEAVRMFKLCLSDFQAARNNIRQGYVLLNIGLTYIELEMYEEAISGLNEALSIALNEKDLHLVEICYQNVAKCYFHQKEVNLAKSVIDTARKFLPGLNSQALTAELNLIDCRILRVMGSYVRAGDLLEQTLQLSEKYKLTAVMADALFEQGLLARDQGSIDIARSKLDAAACQFKKIGMEKSFKETVHALSQLERNTNALQHSTG